MALKEIKNRIKSIKNLKRVTDILEKISIIRVKKLLKATLPIDSYEENLENYLQDFLYELKVEYPLEFKKVLEQNLFIKKDNLIYKKQKLSFILFFSSKGLCGFYNNHIYNSFYKSSKDLNPKVFAFGNKAKTFLSKDLLKDHLNLNLNDKTDYYDPDFDLFYKEILKTYKQDPLLSEIRFLYIDNKSHTEVQEKVILPFCIKKFLNKKEEHKKKGKEIIYDIDNNPIIIFNDIIKELIRIKLYKYFLKSLISENLIRHLSTKQASKKAEENIHDFQLLYNKERQNKITQEIVEIVSSAKVILKK